jgi:hypothetical protein
MDPSVISFYFILKCCGLTHQVIVKILLEFVLTVKELNLYLGEN